MDSSMDFWLEAVIKRWHRDQALERVLNVEISSLPAESKGYLSQMWRVSLDIILASGERRKKRFIVKKIGSSEFAKAFEVKLGIFRKEVQMYSCVLKKMENLMSQYGDSKACMWPRLYGFSQYDTLILDDLFAKGYEIIDVRELMGLEESLLVMVSLARFHALGMVLLDKGVVDRNEFGVAPLLQDHVRFPFLINPFRDIIEAMRNTWGSEWLSTADKIEGIMDEFPQRMDEIFNTENSLMNTINHGDFKANNFMIKKNWHGQPVKCKIVDFQLVNYNSFTYDIHFFLMTSINPEIRRNNYKKLIKAYYSALAETLRCYEYPKQIPSQSQVEDEVSRSSLMGFLTICPATSFALNQEKKNFDSSASETAHEVKAFDSKIYHLAKFKEWFAQDICNFIEKGALY